MCTKDVSNASAQAVSRPRLGIEQLLAGLVLTAAMLWAAVAPARATSPVLETTYTTSIANGWVQVERWRDPGAAFVQETFPPETFYTAFDGK